MKIGQSTSAEPNVDAEMLANLESHIEDPAFEDAEETEEDEDLEEEIDPDDTVIVDEESDDEETDEEGETEEGEEAPGIQSLDALAEEFGVETDDVLESIMVDNGFGEPVALGAALNGWREAEATLDTRRTQLEEEHRGIAEAKFNEATQHIQKITVLAEGLLKEFHADEDSVDWDLLEKTDPVEWQKKREAQNRRKGIILEAGRMLEVHGQRAEGLGQEQMRAIQEREAKTLLRKMPSWGKDAKKLNEVIDENTSLMTQLGFSQDEIAGIADHRQIIVLHMAAQWAKSQKNLKTKKVKEDIANRGLRRVSKPGRAAREAHAEPNVGVRKKAKQRFSKSGSTKDAASLIETMLK